LAPNLVSADKWRLDFAGLLAGVYVIVISSKNGVQSFKAIKQD
jgi:hypothetical protein